MAKSKFMENAESLSIEYALPTQESVYEIRLILEIKISDTLFICGDNLLNGSINVLKNRKISPSNDEI
jgi:hypothetical protein